MIIFLDFDGVLHPEHCAQQELFCRLGLFETWLRERPAVDVVISSSWRESVPLDTLKGYFAPNIQSRVIGTTPISHREPWDEFEGELPPLRFVREAEVSLWLRQRGPASVSWAALDDQAWRYKPFNPRLVVCDGTVGLTPNDLDRLDALI